MINRGLKRLVQCKQLGVWVRSVVSSCNSSALQVAEQESFTTRKLVSKDILKCNYVSDFQYVFEREKGNLTAVHMSVGITKLSKVLAKMAANAKKVQGISEDQSSQEQGIELICFLCNGLNQHMDELSTQSVANSLWAITNLFQSVKNIEPSKKLLIEQTFQKLVERAGQISKTMNAHDVTNVIWSVARNKQMFQSYNEDNNIIIRNLMDRCLNILPNDFRPQGIANIMWGLSYMGFTNTNVARRFVLIAKQQLEDFKFQEICMFLWSLQKMRWRDPELLEMIAQIVIKFSVSEIESPVDVATLVMSFAEFRFHNRTALEILIKSFCKLFSDNNSQFRYSTPQNHFRTGANLIYALAVLNSSGDYAQQVLDLIMKYSKNIENIHAQQLYVAKLFFDAQGEEFELSRSIYNLGQEEHRRYVQQGINQKKSDLLKQVVDALDDMKFQYKLGQSTLDGDEEIQIQILNLGRKKVVVRPLEGSCYTTSKDKQLLGTVEAHIELLQTHGWSVILVPFFEWNQYRTTNSRAEYLLRRLEKVK